MAAAAINPHVKRQRTPSEFVPAMPIARKQTTEQVVNNLNQWLKVFQGGRN